MQPTAQLATSLEAGLASCGEFFDADELALLETAAERREFGRVRVWSRDTGVAVVDGEGWRARCPYDRIQQGSLVVLSETETATPLKAARAGARSARDPPPPLGSVDPRRREQAAAHCRDLRQRARAKTCGRGNAARRAPCSAQPRRTGVREPPAEHGGAHRIARARAEPAADRHPGKRAGRPADARGDAARSG